MTGHAWMERIGRPILVGALVSLVVAAMLPLVSSATPSWHDRALPPFCGLIALEAMASYRIVQGDRSLPGGSAGVRLLELLSLAVCRQLWIPLFGGSALLWTGFPRLHFSAILLSVFAFLPLGGAWLAGTQMASAYRKVDAGEHRVRDLLTPAARVGLAVLAGGILVVSNDLMVTPRVLHAAGVIQPLPLPWIVLLYTALAVIVLADIRFSSLRFSSPRLSSVRLSPNGLMAQTVPTPVAPEVPRAWLKGGSVVVGAALAVALLAPGAWQIAGRHISAPHLPNINLSLGTSTGRPASEQPFAAGPGRTSSPPPPSEPSPRTDARADQGPGPRQPPVTVEGAVVSRASGGFHLPIDGMMGSLQFLLPWLIIVASVGYRFHRRRHGTGDGMAISAFLSELLAGLIQGLKAIPSLLARPAIRRRRPRTRLRDSTPVELERPARRRHLRLPHWRTPRERVIGAYHGVAHKARQHGLREKPGQSPRELTAAISTVLPERERDMVELAHRYVEARYSLHKTDSTAVGEARKAAQRIRRALTQRP